LQQLTASVEFTDATAGGVLNGTWERTQDTNMSEDIEPATGLTESSGVFTFPATGRWERECWSDGNV
jgi:hypothetical protein